MITWIKEFYGSLIDLIGFIVGHTSDHGADIAIRALPILSPMPNAIGMYYVSMTVLSFGHWQALAFALAIEFALFGLFEVALMMFDGVQLDERRYKWPFGLSVAVAIIVMALIILVVWRLETAHPILAVLPLFSAAGAVALALRRWHARNQTNRTNELEAAKVAEGLAKGLAERLEAKLADAEAMATEWRAEALALRNQVAYMEKQTFAQPIGVSEPPKTTPKANGKPTATERRAEIFKLLCQTSSKAEANFAEWSRTFGVSDTAVRGDLEWLKSNGYWLNGDDWKPTAEGIRTFGEPSYN